MSDNAQQMIQDLSTEINNPKHLEEARDWLHKFKNYKNSKYKTSYTPSSMDNLKYSRDEAKTADYLLVSNLIARSMLDKLMDKGINKLVVLHENAPLIEYAIRYLLDEHVYMRFNKYKGCYYFGNNSSGKTFAMSRICYIINQLFYSTGYDVPDKINMVSYESLSTRCALAKSTEPVLDLKGSIYLDDLGYLGQSSQNHFGNQVDLLVSIVLQLKKQYELGHKIIITSNLTPDYIMNHYGKGTHDRLFEMCNVEYWQIEGEGFRVN